MTQLVFVHGVATRAGPGLTQSMANRDTLFREILFDGQMVTIRSPLWGDLVPEISSQVFPTDQVHTSFSLNTGATGGAFGGLGAGMSGAGAVDEPAGRNTADLAAADPVTALDAVFAELVDAHDREGTPLDAADIAKFRAAALAIADDDAGSLLGTPGSDAELKLKLGEIAKDDSSYGVLGKIGDAVTAVTDRIRNTASTAAFGLVRDSLSPAIGLFLGDVFTYLREGSTRDKIQERIRKALLDAHAAGKTGEKVVAIGHSMGGVILTDMLGSPQSCGLPADLHVDVLITVGSQPGLFQSMHLLRDPAANGRTPKPACVGKWYNVFDPIDPLAFLAGAVFDDVADLKFNSMTGLASAHTTYFKRPQFYGRCRARLQEAGVI